MSRAYALAQPMPFARTTHVGRRLEKVAKRSWAVGFLVLTAVIAGYYVYQMNATASKGYTLRQLQQRQEQLRMTVVTFENRVAQMQSLRTIEEKVAGLGYVPVDRMEFVDVGRSSYALAK